MIRFNIIILLTSLFLSHQPMVLADNEKSNLGRLLYFDTNLSKNRTQSCSTCHNPKTGFVDQRGKDIARAASLGDNGHSLGDRSAPTASYASFSPPFHYDKKKKQYIGGQFWDGRALDLQAQAGGPPLNPNEMGLSNKQEVKQRLLENNFYVTQFKQLYGADIFDNNDQLYLAMTDSIAAYEKTSEFSPFDSKYDRYLKDEYELTGQEELGMSLFFSNNNNSCANCHVLKGEDEKGETFTNYEFHNIGTPANTNLRAINGVGANFIDQGLLNNPAVTDKKQAGKYKVPTLRNIAVTAPYMHNGVFKELETVIEFYDKYNNKKRTLNPETGKPWRQAEVENTINKKDLKAKKLSDTKVKALVAFLQTLTDKRFEKDINH